jgi:hypothetical protein
MGVPPTLPPPPFNLLVLILKFKIVYLFPAIYNSVTDSVLESIAVMPILFCEEFGKPSSKVERNK